MILPPCNHFNKLPQEITILILSYLDSDNLQELCQVNRLFYSLLCSRECVLRDRFSNLITKYNEFIINPSAFKEITMISWGKLKHVEDAFDKFLGNWVFQMHPYGGLAKVVLKGSDIKCYLITGSTDDAVCKTLLFKLNLYNTSPNTEVYITACNLLGKGSHCCCIAVTNDGTKLTLKCELAVKHDKSCLLAHFKDSYSYYNLEKFSEEFHNQIRKQITFERIKAGSVQTCDIFMGRYGEHGLEFQHLVKNDDYLMLVKVSGDSNVPFQKTSVYVDLNKFINLSLAINHMKEHAGWINDCTVSCHKTKTVRTTELINGLQLDLHDVPQILKELFDLGEFKIKGVYQGQILLRSPPSQYYYNDVIFIIINDGLFIAIWDVHEDGYLPKLITYQRVPQLCRIQSSESNILQM